MNAYIAHSLEVSLADVITHAATQIEMKPIDLLIAAIYEAIEDPDWDGAIGDLEGAYAMGETAGVITLTHTLIKGLDAEQINALKLRLPR